MKGGRFFYFGDSNIGSFAENVKLLALIAYFSYSGRYIFVCEFIVSNPPLDFIGLFVRALWWE